MPGTPHPVVTVSPPRGRRIRYGVLLLVTIALGLASRRHPDAFPAFVSAFAGDTLWASAVYFCLSLLAPGAHSMRRGLLALAVSVAVERSQLLHHPGRDAFRRTTPGGLLLGFGFLWSDLACYAVGVCLALLADELLVVRRPYAVVR